MAVEGHMLQQLIAPTSDGVVCIERYDAITHLRNKAPGLKITDRAYILDPQGCPTAAFPSSVAWDDRHNIAVVVFARYSPNQLTLPFIALARFTDSGVELEVFEWPFTEDDPCGAVVSGGNLIITTVRHERANRLLSFDLIDIDRQMCLKSNHVSMSLPLSDVELHRMEWPLCFIHDDGVAVADPFSCELAVLVDYHLVTKTCPFAIGDIIGPVGRNKIGVLRGDRTPLTLYEIAEGHVRPLEQLAPMDLSSPVAMAVTVDAGIVALDESRVLQMFDRGRGEWIRLEKDNRDAGEYNLRP